MFPCLQSKFFIKLERIYVIYPELRIESDTPSADENDEGLMDNFSNFFLRQ